VLNSEAVARTLGFTEASLAPYLNLLYLTPDIQLQVLQMEVVTGVQSIHEKALREVAATIDWGDQRKR